jgi:hypothetical protein
MGGAPAPHCAPAASLALAAAPQAASRRMAPRIVRAPTVGRCAQEVSLVALAGDLFNDAPIGVHAGGNRELAKLPQTLTALGLNRFRPEALTALGLNQTADCRVAGRTLSTPGRVPQKLKSRIHRVDTVLRTPDQPRLTQEERELANKMWPDLLFTPRFPRAATVGPH